MCLPEKSLSMPGSVVWFYISELCVSVCICMSVCLSSRVVVIKPRFQRCVLHLRQLCLCHYRPDSVVCVHLLHAVTADHVSQAQVTCTDIANNNSLFIEHVKVLYRMQNHCWL